MARVHLVYKVQAQWFLKINLNSHDSRHVFFVPLSVRIHFFHREISYSLWHDVLEPVSVLVFQSRHHDLPPLPPGGLQLEEGGGRGFPPFRQEHDERERFEGVLKQTLEVGDHAVHQLLAERRVGFKGTAQRLEVHYRSGTKRQFKQFN